MSKKTHLRPTDVRGVSRLVVDATLGLTRLVETMHHNIVRTPAPLGQFTEEPTRGITGFVYRSIQGTTRLVGRGVDALLEQLMPLLDQQAATESSDAREAVLAALNGVLGDHLAASANPLAITMQLRRDGQPLPLTKAELAAALPQAGGKILLLVHGLCMNDRQWRRNGHDHGAALATAGFTPLYLHYNSGRHVSSNGRELAELLQTLVQAWPVPVEQLTIVGHSMGGLLARSACHYGQRGGHTWLRHLRQMVFLGTPHHGAPLERGGNWVNVILEFSPYTAALARLAKIRSAGITDLRHGSVLDDDWLHGDRFARDRKKNFVPLPAGVRCDALAVTRAKPSDASINKLPGDGLVPVQSALGQADDPALCLDFPAAQRWIGYGMHHLDLLDHAEVYAQLQQRLVPAPN